MASRGVHDQLVGRHGAVDDAGAVQPVAALCGAAEAAVSQEVRHPALDPIETFPLGLAEAFKVIGRTEARVPEQLSKLLLDHLGEDIRGDVRSSHLCVIQLPNLNGDVLLRSFPPE